MAMAGPAFLIMWHDIVAHAESDYQLWHTREHMPERLALPGFLRGRRGVNRGLGHQRYLTLYEGATLQTFTSPEYLRSLNQPTPWTSHMAPAFRNFLRVACETLWSVGGGVGGAIATFRGKLPSSAAEADLTGRGDQLSARLMAIPGVNAVHCAGARPQYSDVPTRETELRPRMPAQPFDAIVIVEGVGLAELLRESRALEQIIHDGGLTDIVAQIYDMAFLLARNSDS
jgi:hypothetical protein